MTPRTASRADARDPGPAPQAARRAMGFGVGLMGGILVYPTVRGSAEIVLFALRQGRPIADLPVAMIVLAAVLTAIPVFLGLLIGTLRVRRALAHTLWLTVLCCLLVAGTTLLPAPPG